MPGELFRLLIPSPKTHRNFCFPDYAKSCTLDREDSIHVFCHRTHLSTSIFVIVCEGGGGKGWLFSRLYHVYTSPYERPGTFEGTVRSLSGHRYCLQTLHLESLPYDLLTRNGLGGMLPCVCARPLKSRPETVVRKPPPKCSTSVPAGPSSVGEVLSARGLVPNHDRGAYSSEPQRHRRS